MELIDRQEVVNLICDSKDLKELFDRVYDEIPIIESRPKGEGTINEAFGGTSNAYCSRCGYEVEPEVRYAIGLPPFCFNCGADMRGEDKWISGKELLKLR